MMEVTGYVAIDIETATYNDNVVLIITTKQDSPTVVVLSDDEVESLIADLQSRRKWLFQRLWDNWNETIRRKREALS